MPLQAQPLVDNLARPWIGLTLVAESPSTNADLAAAARAGSTPLWSVLVAEHQTAGRGRLGRSWVTEPGVALTFSALVPAPPEPGWVPLLVGLAVAEAVENAYGLRPALKWPNDLLAPDGGKLAGVLCELTPLPGHPRGGIIVGIGLNVDQERNELPMATATSLREVAGGHPPDFSRETLLLAVLDRLATQLEVWARDPASVREAYRMRCSTLGQEIRVDLGADGAHDGAALRIDDDGRLVVDLDGSERALAAGDVTHVRPRRFRV